ncbi:MAG: 16S rRNA (guanine(527)-N(7))-methyltransferase RsmG [Actinomycetota bacterium]
MKHDASSSVAAVLGQKPSEAQVDQLLAFEQLLVTRATPLGFVSASDGGQIFERHLLDSARAAPFLAPGTVADLGSGAGLPGIVLAILRPDALVHLVEPQRRRLAFLELALETLQLGNAVPRGVRVEQLEDRYPTAVARAFADAETSWRLAEPRLAPEGRLIYFGGRTFDPAGLDDLGASVRTVPPPALLASAGPLVIMGRQ